MRERLIDLIIKADEDALRKRAQEKAESNRDLYGFIADYLLDNGVIVLPCKVGDIVNIPMSEYFKEGKLSRINMLFEKPNASRKSSYYCIPFTDKNVTQLIQANMDKKDVTLEQAVSRIKRATREELEACLLK